MKKTTSRVMYSSLNLLTGFGGSILTILLSFITRSVFIHMLGRAYLGINGLFSDILIMLSLTELGLDTAINFRLYKPLAEKDDKTVRILLKFYKQAYRVVGCGIFALGLLVFPLLKYLIKDYDSLEALGINAFLIFMLYLLQSASSYLFFAYRSAVIKADQHEYITNLANYLTVTLSNIAQIIVLLVWKDFIVYTAVAVLFTVIGNLINAVIAQRMYPQFFEREPDRLSRGEVSSMLKDCGALFLYKVNGVVLKATDTTVISAFIGLEMAGVYSNYLMLFRAIRSILVRFYNASKASMGNLYATEDVSKSYFLFEVMNFLSILLYGTACVGIAVSGSELIQYCFGADFVIPQPFALLMGVEILFAGIKINLGQIRNISGAFRQMWYRPLTGIIVNLTVSILLVRYWGVCGVLVGTIAADFFTNFMVDPSIIHKYSFKEYQPVSRYYKKNTVYFLLLLLVGLCDGLICSRVLVGRGLLSLAFHIMVCGASVPAVFLLVYWKSDVGVYLRKKAVGILSKKRGRN